MGKRQTKHFRIDPQEELIRATGYSYDRRSCILSFADGLQSAGHEVFIKHLSLPEVAHINPYPTMLVYHLLGLIVGNNGNMPSLEPWYQFCRTMTRVPHRLRPDVLHFTAEYSFDRPQGPIEPLAPIGLLL